MPLSSGHFLAFLPNITPTVAADHLFLVDNILVNFSAPNSLNPVCILRAEKSKHVNQGFSTKSLRRPQLLKTARVLDIWAWGVGGVA